jgi:hypothetical protein
LESNIFSSESSSGASTDDDILIDKNVKKLINKISTDDNVLINTTVKNSDSNSNINKNNNFYFYMQVFISHIPSNGRFFKKKI